MANHISLHSCKTNAEVGYDAASLIRIDTCRGKFSAFSPLGSTTHSVQEHTHALLCRSTNDDDDEVEKRVT